MTQKKTEGTCHVKRGAKAGVIHLQSRESKDFQKSIIAKFVKYKKHSEGEQRVPPQNMPHYCKDDYRFLKVDKAAALKTEKLPLAK